MVKYTGVYTNPIGLQKRMTACQSYTTGKFNWLPSWDRVELETSNLHYSYFLSIPSKRGIT